MTTLPADELVERRLLAAAEARADALAKKVDGLKDDKNTLARALYWFIKYPEFKPNYEHMEEVVSDLLAARPLVPADRAALAGERPSQRGCEDG